MQIIVIFITLTLLGMAGITFINWLTFARLGRAPAPLTWPQVSILIPARNEATVIEATLRHLLTQDYPHLEIILLDDHSTDETAMIAQRLAQSNQRLRIISGQPLPPNWLGKNWACQQLGQAARGEWLIFTDADVQWSPLAVRAVIAEAWHTKADLLTVWPTQQTVTWAERLTVPLMALVVLGYLPWPLVHHTPSPMFAAANGQCLAFRRAAYQRIGGHAPVAHQVLEDVLLARFIKAQGLCLRMVDGAGLIHCRMYYDWLSVRDGYSKNILAGYGGRVSLLLLATLFHWLIFLGPWLWLVVDYEKAAILIALGLVIRALTAHLTRQRWYDAWLMPPSVILMTRIAMQAIWWRWRYGGPLWKGRVVQ